MTRPKLFIIILAVFTMFFNQCLFAQSKNKTSKSKIVSPVSNNPQWNAKWIWQKESGPDNTWLCFRRYVKIKEKPLCALTRIAAENKYWLFINGRLVVADGGMDIRPDLKNTYYDSLDIAEYLHQGENIIAILTWFKGGKNGYSQNMAAQGGLLFESHISGSISPVIIKSDSSWKVKIHPAFAKTSQQQQWGDYKWVEYPVIFDSRDDIIKWTKLNYNDKNWQAAVVKAGAMESPWNQLINRTIPMHKIFEPIDLKTEAKLPLLIKSDTTITVDIGNNLQGSAYLKIDSKSGGDTIFVRMNEWYTEKYITKAGLQEYTTFQWQNTSGQPWSKHCVEFSFRNVNSKIRVLDLKFKPSGYNTKVLGSFKSDNEQLNVLWKKCLNTSYVCMRDQFYDCPDRERGQWWGDVSEQILYSFYLYDLNASLLAKKGYRELLNTQKEDGSLYTTAPGNRFHLPDQNLAAIMSLGDYFLYAGDTALVRELYPKISNYIKQYVASTRNSDNMLILKDGVWNWIDWGDSLDVKTGSANTVVNGLFIRLMETLKILADASGHDQDIYVYDQMQNQVKNKFNSYFWNEDKNAYSFHSFKDTLSVICDDRSNAWAALAGVVDSTRREGVLNILNNRLWASPYQERYIEEALFVLGSPEAALKRMLKYYQLDINSWSQTMWERMGNNSTNNHAWAASPSYLLGAYVAGIRPSEPGFSKFKVIPALGGLTYVSASVPTVKGVITSIDSLTSDKFVMKLTSPKGTEAIVGIPKEHKWHSITVNGIKAWEDGRFFDKTEAIMGAGEDEKYIKFKVQSGTWNFIALAGTKDS